MLQKSLKYLEANIVYTCILVLHPAIKPDKEAFMAQWLCHLLCKSGVIEIIQSFG